MAKNKETVASGTRPGGDTNSIGSDTKAQNTSEKHGDHTHHLVDKKVSEEVTSTPQSHKRTFSTGPDQNSVDDPSTPVSPPNKKAKCDPHSEPPESANSPDTQIAPDDGDDLIPLVSRGPNVFYGYADGLLDFLEYGRDGGNEGCYWLKSMVMDTYKSLGDKEYIDPGLPCVGITCDLENLQTSEAKLLGTHFEGLHGDWWYEVTLTREEPEGKRVRVELESSRFDQEGYMFGGKELGEWWMSDIKEAKGESKEAIEAVHPKMI